MDKGKLWDSGGEHSWRTTCRCGEPLRFSAEDIGSGQPVDGADFFCSIADPKKGPHDWGVVRFTPEIAPCAVCGGPPKIRSVRKLGRMVHLFDCECGPLARFEGMTRIQAIEQWNERERIPA